MKKILVLISFIMIISLAFVFVHLSKPRRIMDYRYYLEYGDNFHIDIGELLHTDDIDIINSATLTYSVDFEEKGYPKLGEHIGSVKYKHQGKEKAIDFRIIVDDTTAPVLVQKEGIIVELDKEIDYDDYFEIIDLTETTYMVDESELDLSKEGEYKIVVSINDDYGNKAEYELIVIVK